MRATELIVAIAATSILSATGVASATTTRTFESIALDGSGVYNGSDLAGGFEQGGVVFNNDFTDFGGGCCWTGWSASNNTDTVTPGFTNEFSAYPGSAAGGSQFGVAYTDAANITLTNPTVIEGGFFTNTTYAALSMLNGDGFAKKFGGPTGDDPDWFNITIEGWLGGVSTGTEVFYLADYRSPNNSEDYIVDAWTFVDLSGLETVDQLSFTFGSSDDVGGFGVNTPTYFALDDLQLVPEPGTGLLVGLGLVGMTALRRRG
jgi:hypothetical protein